MPLPVLFLTAVGLAADATAVAVGRGLRMPRLDWRQALLLAITFGVFQGLMPVIGWALGSAFVGIIASADHWIAFGLLSAIGIKMLWEAWRSRGDDDSAGQPAVTVRAAVLLGVATSIDALAVGVSLAFLDVNIVLAAIVIAVVTTALSLVGVVVGHKAGTWLAGWAEAIGGLLLIGIGTAILIEHLSG